MAQDTIKDVANGVVDTSVEAARFLSNTALDLMKDHAYGITLGPLGHAIDYYRSREADTKELVFDDCPCAKTAPIKDEMKGRVSQIKDGILKASPLEEGLLSKDFSASDARQMSVENMDKLIGLTRLLPDGKYSAGLLKPLLDRAAGAYLDKETAALVANIDSLEKKGNHFEINFNRTTTVKLGEKVPGTFGMVSVKDLTMDHVSFDLNSTGGRERLDNIQGMKVNYSGPTGGFDGSVKSLSVGRAQDGSIRYEANVTQNSTLARAVGVPGEFRATLKPDSNGNLVLTNGKEIETKVRKPIGF